MSDKAVNKSLAEKLASVMSQIETLKEDEKHTQGWTFASVGSMYQAVRPLIAKQGIVIVPQMLEVSEQKIGQTSKGNDIILTKARFEMLVTDGSSELRVPWHSKAIDFDDKGVNKCATSAMKYFLKTFFLISTGDEADPDHSSAPQQARQQARPNVQKQAPARAQKPKEQEPWQRWKTPEDAILWADEWADPETGEKLFEHPKHAENAYNKAKREYAASQAPNAKANARDFWRYWFEKVEARGRGEEYVLPTYGSQKLPFDGPIDEEEGLEFTERN